MNVKELKDFLEKVPEEAECVLMASGGHVYKLGLGSYREDFFIPDKGLIRAVTFRRQRV